MSDKCRVYYKWIIKRKFKIKVIELQKTKEFKVIELQKTKKFKVTELQKTKEWQMSYKQIKYGKSKIIQVIISCTKYFHKTKSKLNESKDLKSKDLNNAKNCIKTPIKSPAVQLKWQAEVRDHTKVLMKSTLTEIKLQKHLSMNAWLVSCQGIIAMQGLPPMGNNHILLGLDLICQSAITNRRRGSRNQSIPDWVLVLSVEMSIMYWLEFRML